MTWIVDCDKAFDEFAERTDPEEDAGLRLAVLLAMVEWIEFGPPADSHWSEDSLSYYCDIRGAIVAEFDQRKMQVPPSVYVIKFHWHPPLN